MVRVSYNSKCPLFANVQKAGIPIESVSGTDTAVFTGSFGDDHKIISLKDAERLSPHAGSSTTFSMLANRLSWWFNLKGPSMNIDTACSSSLVGLHLACQSLCLRESSMVRFPAYNLRFSKMHALTSDVGSCRRQQYHVLSGAISAHVKPEYAFSLRLLL